MDRVSHGEAGAHTRNIVLRVRRVLFVPRKRAIQMLGRARWAMVSITDPGYEPADLTAGWGALLRLSFHDVDSVTFPGWDLELRKMQEADATAVARFVAGLPAGTTNLIVHCEAGISRSAGVAKAIAEHLGVPFPEDYAEYNRYVYDRCRKALVSLTQEPDGAGSAAPTTLEGQQ